MNGISTKISSHSNILEDGGSEGVTEDMMNHPGTTLLSQQQYRGTEEEKGKLKTQETLKKGDEGRSECSVTIVLNDFNSSSINVGGGGGSVKHRSVVSKYPRTVEEEDEGEDEEQQHLVTSSRKVTVV